MADCDQTALKIKQIEIDAIIGSSVSNLSWMNFNTMLLVLTKTNNLIQVK